MAPLSLAPTERRLDDANTLAMFDSSVTGDLDTMWLLIGAILVFFMQTGYAMLEVGSVSNKNTRTILLKNVMDASLGALLFGTAGYGFAYGDTGGMGLLYGVVGKDHFLLAKDDFETADGSGYMYASWMFQWALAATTCSIVSGAMCERTTLTAHVVFTMLLVGLIYPIVACVAWSEQGFLSAHQKDDSERLFGCGMLDAAGSGVVHLTGGVAALVGVMVLGPRRAFLVNELEVPEYGPVFQTLGTLLLWFGWYGFNAVSTLHLVGFAEVAAKTMVTTTIAASGGALSALLTSTLSKGVDDETGSYRLRLEYGNKGALAGLVAISAGCSVMEPYGALITGLGAGPLYYFTSEFLVEYGIDDVVDAFPIHGMCGAFGVIMAGVMATEHNYSNAFHNDKGDKCVGVAFGGNGSQLAANAIAVLAIFLWSALCSYLVFKVLMVCRLLRVSEEVEDRGMDMAEHGRLHRNASNVVTDTQAPATLADLDDEVHMDHGGGDDDDDGAAAAAYEARKKKSKPKKKGPPREEDLDRLPSYADTARSAPGPKKKKKETELTSSV